MITGVINNEFKNFRNWMLNFIINSKYLNACTDSGMKNSKSKMEYVKEFESTSRQQPKWEREETVILVAEYFRTRNMNKGERDRSVEFVSKILKIRAKKLGLNVDNTYRNITGIEMKFGNIKSLDKEAIGKGYSGLKNASTLDKTVVDEYYVSKEKINQDAYFEIMKYMKI